MRKGKEAAEVEEEETRPLLSGTKDDAPAKLLDVTPTPRDHLTTVGGVGGLGDTWPSQQASCWSSLFFSWVRPILTLGSQRPLESADLYQLDPWNRAHELSQTFQKYWNQRQEKLAQLQMKDTNNTSNARCSFRRRHRLVWTLCRAFGAQFLAAGLLRLVSDSLKFVAPMIIKKIIHFLSNPEAPIQQGLVYTAIIFWSGVGQSFALRQYVFCCNETGLRLRSAVCMAVFEKTLRLSSSARQKKTTGEILNLMSIDVQRLQDLTNTLHNSWDTLFQIIVACVLLWGQIGVATLAGVGVIVLLIPTMSWISRTMRVLQRRLMQVKDERIKVCHEVLAGIKVIKLQAWEKSFIDRVMQFRANELKRLRTYIFTQSFSNTIFTVTPALVTVASFLAYVLLGNVLDVGTALTSIALFNVLRLPLFQLPRVINNVIEATVSFDRLQTFLLEEEYEKVSSGALQEVGVRMENAAFRWTSSRGENAIKRTIPLHPRELRSPAEQSSGFGDAVEEDESPTVRNISFSCHSGELIAIVGQVGSGKSTILGGLLGDANIVQGNVALRGSVAFVAQQPFIMNATVRDNICFSLPFDKTRYDQAIQVSCLKKDLAILPGGDLTEIGEKGINLSGGQRTRVALARAVYQDADIYILDDILSAVDSHVGSDIFTNCIKKHLKTKVVLLVTHSLSFLNQCDHIIVMDQGEIAEQGSFDDVMARNGMLSKMVARYVQKEEFEQLQTNPAPECDAALAAGDDMKEAQGIESSGSQTSLSCTRSSRVSSSVSDSATETAKANETSKLMTIEDRSVGEVKWGVYMEWVRAFGGPCAAMVVLLSYGLAQMTTLLSTFWISHWSIQAQSHPENQMYYVYVFMGLNGAYAAALFIRVLLLYMGGLRASRLMFNELLSQVLRAPISFFDTTPLGRIVNRLSKDVYTVDESIPPSWNSVLNTIISVLVTIITITYVTPVFMVVLVPVMIVYYMTQRYFIMTSRELQRLDSISRSPIFALFGETLDGISTIRAFNVENDFIHRNEVLLDTNQRAFFLNFATNCWLGIHLQFLGTIIATAAALTAVLSHESSSPAFAGLVGVSLTYAFSITHPLQLAVRVVSQLQTQMVSVERIKAYSEMPTEPPLQSEPDIKPTYEWPQQGEITFQNVSLRYRPGLPRVLRNISFTAKPREKIGIVGRTGAGKSSLIVGLMRLTELDSGVIKIDGVDISSIGLHDLRGKISIIPQDPVLFSGSVRANLDPFDQFSDDQIWTSIKRAHLQNAVTALDEKVEERGCNFSVGERQLLCIARALLRRSRVILMDEATASIDTETDRKIQQSIREEFKECTCLTVAHRINTILDSDRVLVMDKGAVAEFATPEELQKNPMGIFKSLVDHWRQDRRR